MSESAENNPASRLPEHLRFVLDMAFLDNPDQDESVKEMLEYVRKFRAHREELKALGIDADGLLAKFGPKADELEVDQRALEEAEDRLLHQHANVAEKSHELFKFCDAAVKNLEEERAFDPQLQELREKIEEHRRQYPKE